MKDRECEAHPLFIDAKEFLPCLSMVDVIGLARSRKQRTCQCKRCNEQRTKESNNGKQKATNTPA